jgi:hypothetical protein
VGQQPRKDTGFSLLPRKQKTLPLVMSIVTLAIIPFASYPSKLSTTWAKFESRGLSVVEPTNLNRKGFSMAAQFASLYIG